MPNTREKLVEEKVELSDVICYAMRDWDDYMDECRETETPPIDSFEDFIADGVISAGYRKQEWISVKDRLPEKWQNVLVVRTDGAFRFDFVGSLDVWYDDVNFVGYPVTHWMPLPEPPKGE